MLPRPLRLNSMKEPVELRTGMVFALETYCPAADGHSAARLEEEVVLTDEGPGSSPCFLPTSS
jgi:Xaa-Pro aminopeptidase